MVLRVSSHRRPGLNGCPLDLFVEGCEPVEVNQDDILVVPFDTRVHLVRNRAAARMANDENRISARVFDRLDHRIELLAEAVDGVVTVGPRAVGVGKRLKPYVAVLFFSAGQPEFHVGLRSSKSAEENNQDAHLFTPFSEMSPKKIVLSQRQVPVSCRRFLPRPEVGVFYSAASQQPGGSQVSVFIAQFRQSLIPALKLTSCFGHLNLMEMFRQLGDRSGFQYLAGADKCSGMDSWGCRPFDYSFAVTIRSMHYERAALLRGAYRVDVRQESEEKIGKSAEE